MAFTFNVIAPTYWISLPKSEDRQQANEVIKLSIDYSLKGGFTYSPCTNVTLGFIHH